jgi:hypothetical protein
MDVGIGARDIAWRVGVGLGGGDRNDVVGCGDRVVVHIGVEQIMGSEWWQGGEARGGAQAVGMERGTRKRGA